MITCTCGGEMKPAPVTTTLLAPRPPWHRKKRILKKKLKRWRDKNMGAILATTVATMMLRARPPFECAACKKRQGFYETMASALFRVDPLPPGAQDLP